MKMTRCISFIAIVVGCLLSVLSVSAASVERQKITSTPRGVGAQFGNAVAISGNTMVVGARFDSTTVSQAGAAYVYILVAGTWTQQAVLLANDGAIADKFGYSVAISGDTIVVGSYNDDAPLSNGGSAYVFVRNGTTWTQQQKLTASDGTADDEFGYSVAIEAETIVVGAHFADLPTNSAAGSAYLFRRSGTVWTEVQKLIPVAGPNGPILGDHFGESLAFSGGKIAVGAAGDDTPETSAGAVYVFADSGAAYILQQKLTIASGTNGDIFGWSVALEGNTLVGGAREDTQIIGQPAYGAAYVFEFNGTTWTPQGKLVASDGASVDRFGWSVAVSNDVIAVGAREDDTAAGPDAGSAYLFKRVGAVWTQRQKLVPSDPFNGDRFGASVALSFGNLVVGASEKALSVPNGQGAAYYYKEIPSCSSPSFSPSLNFGVGVFPVSVAVSDFNGDGKPDLATANGGSDSVSVLLGNGAGGFGTATNFGTGNMPYSVAAGDFNLDGKPDLVVANRDSANVSVLLGNGVGSFGAATNFTVGAGPQSVAVGDFNLDGKPDLVTANTSSDNFSVLLGNGAGSFGAATNFGASSGFPRSVALGDFNLDGKTDLAAANNNSASLLLGNGAGSFGAATHFGDQFTRFSAAVGDFNLDGKPDVATTNAQPNNISVLLGNGAGGLGAAADFGAGNFPIWVVVGDFNLDDQPDLVTANVFSNNVSVLLGNGAGSFATAVNFGVDSSPNSVATGDFNLDGKPDLVTPGSGTVSVRLSTCGQAPRPTAFDFDGDGKTDPSVYRPSMGDWYLLNTSTGFRALHFGLPSDIMVPADFTGDGKTDMAVWRPSDSIWYVLRSEDNTFYGAGFGAAGDIPAPGDYDGDGRADLVVIRPGASQSFWFLQQSTAGFAVVPFGLAGDVPTLGDYDGDGKNDVAVYRPTVGAWFRFNSSNGSFLGVGFGTTGDKVVPADYTGDGKTDLAVFRPSNNIWFILRSEDNSLTGGAFGASGDLPSPGDYDGDGKADLAVYRPGPQSVFYVLQTTAGFNTIPWGLSEDRPVPNAYVY